MTTDRLLSRSKKDLAEMARKKGIVGWHAMRKEELVEALGQLAAKSNGTHKTNGSHKASGAVHKVNGAVTVKVNGVHKADGTDRVRKAALARTQIAAARDTSSEEKVESSKF